jgi:hypothetical protein
MRFKLARSIPGGDNSRNIGFSMVILIGYLGQSNNFFCNCRKGTCTVFMVSLVYTILRLKKMTEGNTYPNCLRILTVEFQTERTSKFF